MFSCSWNAEENRAAPFHYVHPGSEREQGRTLDDSQGGNGEKLWKHNCKSLKNIKLNEWAEQEGGA